MGVNVSAEVALRDVGAASKVSVEELCQKAVEGSLLGGRFTTAHLSQATTLLGQTDAAWRKADLARYGHVVKHVLLIRTDSISNSNSK